MWLWLSQEAPGSLIDLATNAGCLTLVVVGFMGGWIYSRQTVDRLVKENDRLNSELSRRNTVDSEVIIPVLVSSKDLILRLETQLGAGK